MEILRGAHARSSETRPTVVTVGMFDGVHRGHRMLFERVLSEARSAGDRAAVVTFDPHPLEVLAPERAPCLLTTLDQRLALFDEAGFDVALVLPFDRELAALTPEAFARAALVEDLRVRKVLVGEDFRFGKHRTGDIATLREIGRREGFEAESVPLLGGREHKVSSSDIRRFVGEGEVERAAELLGRPFRLAGEVVEGEGRGRSLGFPTANLRSHPRACLPGLGVYAGWWVWEGGRWPAAINVGVRPTFEEGGAVVVEAYVIDFEGNLYGEKAEVEFVFRLRPESKFDSAQDLVRQMRRDVAEVRSRLG